MRQEATKAGIVEMDSEIKYPDKYPYNPSEHYPEYPFEINSNELDKSNRVYELVRNLFYTMGMDAANYGTKKWNPFGSIIKKGDKVVIKPNWVLDVSEHDINALIANMSIIRAIVDYSWIACGSQGKIDILESPIEVTDWQNLMYVTKADSTVEYLKSKAVNIDLQDIRTDWLTNKDVINLFGWRFKVFYRKKLPGTKKGFIHVDLKRDSLLTEVIDKANQFRSIHLMTDNKVNYMHNKDKNAYVIPREILESNVFINVPKLKTHRKAGITLAMKNLVGMIDHKDWHPVYTKGTPEQGGDEGPTKRSLFARFGDWASLIYFTKKINFGFSFRPPGVERYWRKKTEMDLHKQQNVRQGNWYMGNTIWRVIYDLNMILMHADKDGNMQEKNQRKFFCVVDGIISGEKFGPLNSVPKKTGVLIGSSDPIVTEFVGARVMGFDEKKLKTLINVNKQPDKYKFGISNTSDFNKIIIESNKEKWKKIISDPKKVSFHFIPAPGWEEHVEMN